MSDNAADFFRSGLYTTSASTSPLQHDTLTIDKIMEAKRQIEEMQAKYPEKYLLIHPDGRIYADECPWKLASHTGTVPKILKKEIP